MKDSKLNILKKDYHQEVVDKSIDTQREEVSFNNIEHIMPTTPGTEMKTFEMANL